MKTETRINLYKTITYRAVCVLWIFSIAYILTGSVLEGAGWALLHQAVLTIFYYVHEEVWNRHLKKRGMIA